MPQKHKLRIKLKSNNFVWFLLISIVIFSSISSPVFLSSRNLRNVFLIQPIGLGIASLSQAIIIISGGIDMSISSAISLMTTMTAGLFQSNPEMPVYIAVFVLLFAGAAIGAVNGFFVVFLRIPAFMGTLATSLILQGIIYFYTKKPIGGIPRSFRYIAEGNVAGIPVSCIFFIIVFIVSYMLMKKHKAGKLVYAVGANEHISSISGIATRKVRFCSYLAGGILVALASTFLAARMGGGGPTAGTGYELDTITAVVIGGIALSGGTGNPLGIIGGVLILTIFSNTMNLLDINPYIQMFIKGLILILAVSFNKTTIKNRR